ncbi:cytochrome P450/oxidoreductase [Saccharopolyspora sp. HNM0986]|uniref:cytochrome P450/oxidoreductase n=1 Tax=Saccharopolyspora galaxeae TaxID=2781241 RepID=UPI00190AA461|nr:cytochrome P450/oxidoreductase [Saccharopolyspora sp. HNM0986]MBK0870167.1 cytochrome P450/oxidoreductase [Saccharopolyspora sp. HNM0986]
MQIDESSPSENGGTDGRTATQCPFAQPPPVPPEDGCSAQARSFDPFGEDYQQDPPGSLRWSRAEEPVFYSPVLGYWVVTRYADVKAIFQDNIRFSPSIALEKITPVSAEATEVLRRHDYAMARTLVNEDEPAHMPRRRALMEPFTAAALAQQEPVVRRLVRERVDRFIDTGEADLVDELLYEVPLTVALHFLGVPEEDMDKLREYSVAHTVNTWGRPTPEQQVAVADTVGKFWQYAGEVLEKLRKDPSGPGWMPYAIRMQRRLPEVITDSYLHSIMMAGIVAAHETTAHAAANAFRLLLENRGAWREICADPALIPNTVEECLRHSGSVAAWRRITTARTRIGDVTVPEGAKLLIVNSSANHDERHFHDPDEVDIRRENARDHLTFGYGSHQCMGKNLARMELQIFLEEITTRLPHLELVPDQRFHYLPNTSFRGPEHVRVRWDPRDNPERANPGTARNSRPVTIGEPPRRTITRPVEVESIEQAAAGIARITLVDTRAEPLPSWSPGAHVDIELNGMSRQYSLCGDPADRTRYQIAVFREPGGRGGSEYVHDRLRVGDQLNLRGPRNNFKLEPDAGHYVFIAGGIGITPIIAMADAALRAGSDYEIHYCGRSAGAMVLLARLIRDHGNRLTVHCSDQGGRLNVDELLADPREDTQIYACGPQRLLAALETATARWPQNALRVERFEADRGALDPAHEHAFDVELAESGRTVRVAADRSVLAALREADVDVPSDCEQGLCGTCEVSVRDGEVDHRDHVLTRTERRRNDKMMTCCSRARGAKLTLEL